MSYYYNFKIVLGSKKWTEFLNWAYSHGYEDAIKHKSNSVLTKSEKVCLLCGCGNENTAETFIQFCQKHFPGSKVIIVDFGHEQIEAIKNLVKTRYSDSEIEIIETDALKLEDFVKPESVDWIETDGFWEYFDDRSLLELLKIWYKILKKGGFATTRDFMENGTVDRITDFLRILGAKLWPGVNLFTHSLKNVNGMIREAGFDYVVYPTRVVNYKGFTLFK